VLDITEGYLLYAEALFTGRAGLPQALNLGPAAGAPAMTALAAASLFAEAMGERLDWRGASDPYPEKSVLALDSSLARARLGWGERFAGPAAIAAAGAWYRQWRAGEDPRGLSDRLVRQYAAPLAAE
jgi:CDP-glucose 4,6-dehydratase